MEQNKIQSSFDNSYLNSIISRGIQDGNFVLVGFPYDDGDKRSGRKQGVDYGPDCFRRFLDTCGPLINPEYNIDLTSLVIKDYGNISINEIENQTIESYLQKLEIKIGIIKNKYKSIPIIIGGSFDQTYACYQNLFQSTCNNNLGIICIDSNFHLEEQKQITSQNCIRRAFSQFQSDQKDKKLQFCYFGVKQEQKKSEQLKILKQIEKQFSNISIKLLNFEQIKENQETSKQIENIFLPRTNPGLQFQKLLQQYSSLDEIHLSLNLESLLSKYCPGISYQNLKEGFTSEEICEIFLLAGQEKKITAIDISGFNPVIEDFITGRLLVNIIYYFILGYAAKN